MSSTAGNQEELQGELEALRARVAELETAAAVGAKALAALGESEERFQLAVRGTSDGLWDWEVATGKEWWSSRFRELIGHNGDELPPTYESWKSLLHPDDHERTLEAVRRHFNDGQPYDVEYRLKTKNDGYRWFLARGVAARDENGKPVRMAGSIRDITERNRAEAALRQSEARFRAHVEDIPAITYMAGVDDASTTQYISPQAEALLGFSPSTWMETPEFWRERLHPEDHHRVMDEVAASHVSGGRFQSEYRMIAHDGRTVWFHDEATVVRDHNGTPMFLQGVMFDITERKRTEEQLRLLSTAVEQSGEGIAVANLDGILQFVNNAFARMHGYEVEEMLGKHLSVFHIPEQMPAVELANRQIKETGEYSGEVWHASRDGTPFPTLMNNSLLRDEAGNPTGMIGTVQDITQRKRAEAALKKSEAFLNATGRMANVGGWELNAVTKEVRWTEETYRIHEVPLDYPPGLDVALSFYHSEDRPTLEHAVQRALDHGDPFDLELRFTTAKGNQLWVHATCTPHVVDHKTVKLTGTFQDITERKLAAEALRESGRRLSRAQRVAKMGFLDWNLKTNDIYWSDQIYDLYGIDRQEQKASIDLTMELVHPDDLELVKNNIDTAFSGGKEYDIDHRMLRHDGTVIWVHAQAELIRDTDGNPESLLGTVIDITERKRAEEEREKLEAQLRQAQKMEAVGQLAGGVAHDFNNLLTVILGNAEILLPIIERGLNETSMEAAKSGLEEIKLAGQRAAALTRQLMAFSRKEIVRSEVLDPPQVMENAEKMLRRLLREDIVLDMNVAPGTWNIRADAGQIEQVIMNLVLNARDAMPEGGRLVVACANVDVDAAHAAAHIGAQPGPHVLLSVSDTGVGISRETMDHMFEPFFTTKPTGRGTGLGLATVYGIVKQTGAHISVESELGEGATFRVYFPAAAAETAESGPAASIILKRGNEVVLVCEDQELVRRVMCETLRTAGYTVLQAENGRHGLMVAADYAGEIDLLVTDVVMPEMNGKELAEEIAERRPRIRIIFVSGYADDVLAGQVPQKEGQDFLHKPFSPTVLLQRVRELLDHTEAAENEVQNPDRG